MTNEQVRHVVIDFVGQGDLGSIAEALREIASSIEMLAESTQNVAAMIDAHNPKGGV